MDFDTQSLLVGALIGLVCGVLVRLQSLKKLAIRLDQIGMELGIEGFDEKEELASVNVSDIHGTVGDVAGRDIDKSVHNQNFYDKLQSIVQSSVRPQTQIVRQERLQIVASSPSLQQALRQIETSRQDDWFREYVDECLADDQVRADLERHIRALESAGWTVSTLRFDNIRNGIHVNLALSRPFVTHGDLN